MARTTLDHPNPSVRLRAALDAGTAPDPAGAAALVARCASEPDFFVRDMLTWALTRLPAAVTVPLLREELRSATVQARSQALHTLSKIGAADAGVALPDALGLIDDPDDEVAKAAWRTVVALAPAADRGRVAHALVGRLGRGDAETRRSLSRAVLELGDDGVAALRSVTGADAAIREHIADTIRLLEDPDSGYSSAIHEAQRVAALGDRA